VHQVRLLVCLFQSCASAGVHIGLVHEKADEQTALNHGAQEVVVGELNESSAVARALAGMDAAFYIAPVTAFIKNEVDLSRIAPQNA
jgi:hypothetical protein